MPPINCTSKWRILTVRQPASRTTAKASGRISSSAARSACLISSGSVSPSRRAANRALNSAVLAISSESESFCISGSSTLIPAIIGTSFLMTRSFDVPKIFG